MHQSQPPISYKDDLIPHLGAWLVSMTQTIKVECVLKILGGMSDTIKENRDYLTMLDSAIGDGDHGINLDKGLSEVRSKLDELRNKDIGTILKTVGSTLISSVGGAVGPLYGIAFMKAGEVAEGKYEVDLHDLVKMFEAAEEGIVNIGEAKLGEKTMLDALHPSVEALKEATNKNCTLIEALEKSVNAAEKGMKHTKQIIAKRGRSMYIGERSRGHQDVGATSYYLILKSTLEALKA